MSELTFGMRLTYDGKAAGAALDDTKAKLDGVANSSSKLASQYTGLNQGVKQHSTEVKDTEANVRKLLDRYDPLGAKLRQLQDDFNKLNAAAAGGKIAGGDDARTDLVYANLQKQITLASAATDGYATSSNKAAITSGQLRQATQQLPLQFQDIWVSLAAGQNPMMVLAQQGSQISGSFGGVGAAAKAMGNYILGLVNPFTVTAAAVAGGAYALYDYANSVSTARMELMQFKDDLAVMGDTEMLKRVLDLRSAVKKAEFEAVQGGFGSIGKAEEAKKLNEQLALAEAAYSKLRDAETARGDVGGIASKLAHESETAKRRELEYNIKLLQTYHDKQAAGSLNEIDSLSKIGELKKRLADMDKPKSKGGTKDDRTESEKAFADAWIETQRIISNVDPQAKANASWEHLLYLQAALGEQFPLTAEQMGAEYAKSMASIVKETDKAATDMSDTWKNFRDNTQRVFGDQLYDAMTGKFGGIEDAFKQMMFRMAANAAAQGVTDAMFGTNGKGGGASNGVIGGIMKFFGFGGGKAVGGSVASNTMYEVNENGPELLNQGGKDYLMMGGKGGFVKPLGQGGAQISGGSQIVIQDNTQIHIDARSDRAQALSEVSQLIDNKQAQLVDTLRRQKVIA